MRESSCSLDTTRLRQEPHRGQYKRHTGGNIVRMNETIGGLR